MAKLGVGLLGCGGIGLHHARRLVRQEHAELVGVADAVPEAAASASAELGVPAFAGYDELLARPEVAAVLVATPNHTHREATLRAIAAGKHVFCEKPMARTVRECDEMIAAAEARGVKLVVGQVLRLMPPFVRVREMIACGELGRPMMIETCRLAWASWPQPWRRRRDLVWGQLYESNVHELDFMRAICGEAVEVQAVTDTLIQKDVEYEDTALVTIRYASGALGLLRASYCSALSATDGRIICERGAIAYDWGKRRIERRLVGEQQSTVLELDAAEFEDGFAWEQRSFAEWVLFDRPPVVTARDGRAAIELCEAAYLSVERRAPVRLPLTLDSAT